MITKRALCAGLVSRCRGHWHYFFDLDDVTAKDALYSAEYIARTYRCDIIIRKTMNGYHLLCPNPMTQAMVLEMQRWTPTDQNQDYFTLDELKGIFPTSSHWDKPTGSVLRTSSKGRSPPPETVAIIVRTPMNKGTKARVWCEVYAALTGAVPENQRLRRSHPIVVYYATQSKVL